jgi:hypothetical protein
MLNVSRHLILLCLGVAIPFSSGAATAPSLITWQSLARKVGQSEENRLQSIVAIRKIPHLQLQLYRALSTSDRPLALEVIGALNMRALLPDLLTRMTSDADGFTVLAVTSLMTDKNSKQILHLYSEALAPSRIDRLPAPVAVAMLEPFARMNVKLPRTTLLKLSASSSPDIRASLLSYLRVMALRNGVLENLDLVTEMTLASEVQIRLQAISISAELASKPRMFQLSSVKSLDELNDLCLREAGSTLKEACLSFLAVGLATKQ